MVRKFAAGAVIVLVVLVAFIRLHRHETPSLGNGPDKVGEHGTTSQSPAAVNPATVANAAGKAWGIDDLGAPDDPLPTPLPLPTIAGPIQSAHAADMLARQVLVEPKTLSLLFDHGLAILGHRRHWACRFGCGESGWAVAGNDNDAVGGADHSGNGSSRAGRDFYSHGPERSAGGSDARAQRCTARTADCERHPRACRFARSYEALFWPVHRRVCGCNATSHTPYDILAATDPQKIRVYELRASAHLPTAGHGHPDAYGGQAAEVRVVFR